MRHKKYISTRYSISNKSFIANGSIIKIELVKDTVVSTYARRLTPARRLRCSYQSIIKGPVIRCSSSQEWKRSEPLAKNAAASRINGVVGMIGKKIPINPSKSAAKPSAINTCLTNAELWSLSLLIQVSILYKANETAYFPNTGLSSGI